jgi:hypothetical protein
MCTVDGSDLVLNRRGGRRDNKRSFCLCQAHPCNVAEKKGRPTHSVRHPTVDHGPCRHHPVVRANPQHASDSEDVSQLRLMTIPVSCWCSVKSRIVNPQLSFLLLGPGETAAHRLAAPRASAEAPCAESSGDQVWEPATGSVLPAWLLAPTSDTTRKQG